MPPRTFAACVLILLSAAACATPPRPAPPSPRASIVLLPDDQGKTGAIIVSNGTGEKLLSQPRQAVAVSGGGAPVESFVMTEKEVQALAGPALAALPKPPAQYILYFKHDSIELTRESRGLLREVIRAIRERPPVDISVVGHSDTVGRKSYNYQLSLKRARAVASLLTAEGVKPSILEITSHGENNPLIPTGAQVSEPRNRRVEVTVR
ncbi:MAG: OmpA family protein [Deltaproteobacteria bacterium]|nr:OmpA family protein [Deltaproteobacteria bacterium]